MWAQVWRSLNMEQTRQIVGQFNNGITAIFEETADSAVQSHYAPGRENMNSVEQDPGLQARFAKGKSIEDWKIERLENFACSTQAINSMSSYKAQNGKSSADVHQNHLNTDAFWTEVQEKLKVELSAPAYETWLKPCRLDSLEGNTLTLATGSDFNRNIITKRYGLALKQVFSALLGQAVTVRIVVDPALDISPSPETQADMKPAKDTSHSVTAKYPLARFQNPTNNPEVAILLEQYGDLRQVILKSPIFKVPCAKVEEGGWGTGVGGLIALAKEYTLERVLWAVRETKAYRGTREPGKYFNHIVRKGLEADQ